MKKIFYNNSLFFYYAIFFLFALSIEVALMVTYENLSLLTEVWYVFLLQLFAVIIYTILGFAQKFVINSDSVTYVKMFKKQTFHFKDNLFVFGTNNVEPYLDFFGGLKFRHITKFWINLKTHDRQLEILNSNYFNMYMSRRYFKKLHDVLYVAMEKQQLQDNIKLRNFNK